MLSYLKSAAAEVQKGVSKVVNNVQQAANAATQAPIQIAGRTVQVKEQLGEGGFAYVVLVEDVSTGEQFALKRMLCQDQESRNIAEKEIAMLRQLRGHPNIIRMLGSLQQENTQSSHRAMEYFILLELCTGGSLIDLIRRRNNRPLGEVQICDLFLQICKAVAHMHSQQPPIAHRDLKIENVLIDSTGVLKLCDFGSCTTRAQVYATQRERVEEEEVIGKYSTAMYRAPELAEITTCLRPSLVNEKVDVWALGCVLFTIAFFTQPFQDGGNLAILNCGYQLPESHNFSKYLTALIKRLLTVDPVKRPDMQQVLGLVAQWRSWLQSGVGVAARPPKVSRASSETGSTASREAPGPASAVTDPMHLHRHHSTNEEPHSAKPSKRPSKLPKERKRKKEAAAPPAPADDWADFGAFPVAAAPAPAAAAARKPTKQSVGSSSDDSSSDDDTPLPRVSQTAASSRPAAAQPTANLFDMGLFGGAPAAAAPEPHSSSSNASAQSQQWEANFGIPPVHNSSSATSAPADDEWGDFSAAAHSSAPAASSAKAPRAAPSALDFGFDFSGLSPPPIAGGGGVPPSPRSANSASDGRSRRAERRLDKRDECIDVSKLSIGAGTPQKPAAAGSIGNIKMGKPTPQR